MNRGAPQARPPVRSAVGAETVDLTRRFRDGLLAPAVLHMDGAGAAVGDELPGGDAVARLDVVHGLDLRHEVRQRELLVQRAARRGIEP